MVLHAVALAGPKAAGVRGVPVRHSASQGLFLLVSHVCLVSHSTSSQPQLL